MPQFNLLSFKPVVPLFSIYYSFLKNPQFGPKKTIGYYTTYQGAGKRPQPIFPSVYYMLALLLLI